MNNKTFEKNFIIEVKPKRVLKKGVKLNYDFLVKIVGKDAGNLLFLDELKKGIIEPIKIDYTGKNKETGKRVKLVTIIIKKRS